MGNTGSLTTHKQEGSNFFYFNLIVLLGNLCFPLSTTGVVHYIAKQAFINVSLSKHHLFSGRCLGNPMFDVLPYDVNQPLINCA